MPFSPEARFPEELPDQSKQFDLTHDDATDRDSETPSQWAGAFAQRVWNEVHAIGAEVSGAGTGRVASEGGLEIGWSGFRLRGGSGVVDVSAGTLVLPDNATCYVEVDASGVVSQNASGFDVARLPLAEVVTSGGAIQSITDKRAWLRIASAGDHDHDGTASATFQLEDEAGGPTLSSFGAEKVLWADAPLWFGPRTADVGGSTFPDEWNGPGYHAGVAHLTHPYQYALYIYGIADSASSIQDASLTAMNGFVMTKTDCTGNANYLRGGWYYAWHLGDRDVDNGIFGVEGVGRYGSSWESPNCEVIGVYGYADQSAGTTYDVMGVSGYANLFGGTTPYLVGVCAGTTNFGGTADNSIGLWIWGVADGGCTYSILSETTAPADFAGGMKIGGVMSAKAATELTISGGAVTIAKSAHRIDGEADADDDLDTINGGQAGDLLLVYPESAARSITLKHGTGNIATPDGSDYTIPADGLVLLLNDGTTWRMLGSAGGGASALGELSDVNLSAVARGDVLYYDGAGWANLGAGTSGQFLQTQGAGADPQWATPAGSGDMTKAVYDQDDDGAVDMAEGLKTTTGPTELTMGAVADGEYLKRSGSTIVGDTPGGGSGAMTVIDDQELTSSASSITFSSIPGTYKDLKLVLSLRGDDASELQGVYLAFNGASSGHGDRYWVLYGGASEATGSHESLSAALLGWAPCASAPSGAFVDCQVEIADYADPGKLPTANVEGSMIYGASTARMFRSMAFHRAAAGVTQLTLTMAAGDFAAGSRATLYGIG
jgi:hypothetical protein